jgi:hypothetical protein
MISKIWAYLYLWFNNYCPKHVQEKQYATMGYNCPACQEESKARLLANVEHAGKILKS